jgi:hypothetical protein
MTGLRLEVRPRREERESELAEGDAATGRVDPVAFDDLVPLLGEPALSVALALEALASAAAIRPVVPGTPGIAAFADTHDCSLSQARTSSGR